MKLLAHAAIFALLVLMPPVPAPARSGPQDSGSASANPGRAPVPMPPYTAAQKTPAAANPPRSQPANQPAATFAVDVKLVSVFVTVLDAAGAPVSNLTQDDFQLSEDGHAEKIAVFGRESQLPLSIVLAIDTSLSTRKDLPLEVQSARRFAHSIMRPVDALAVYEFSEIVNEVTPFTADLKQIDRGIDGLRPGSATAMYDAIYLASGALEGRQGRKVIVIITDGGDTISKVNYQEALRAAQEAEAIVYSIIVVPISSSAGRDTGGEHALIQLSRDTGGKYYYADSLDRLDRAFDQISQELRTQYLLAYYPSRRVADSDFRQIEVKVHDPQQPAAALAVRHRAGYYTSR
jgi:Ca-activated chloride channel family protein